MDGPKRSRTSRRGGVNGGGGLQNYQTRVKKEADNKTTATIDPSSVAHYKSETFSFFFYFSSSSSLSFLFFFCCWKNKGNISLFLLRFNSFPLFLLLFSSSSENETKLLRKNGVRLSVVGRQRTTNISAWCETEEITQKIK